MRRPISMRVAVAATLFCAWSSLAAPAASAAVGDLTQKPGGAGCFSPFIAGCTTAATLARASGIALSPGGTQVYVAAAGDPGAVAIFDRDAAGALTQKPGTAGCVSEGGAGGCSPSTSMDGPTGVTVTRTAAPSTSSPSPRSRRSTATPRRAS